MGTKHDVLTESEITDYEVSSTVLDKLSEYQKTRNLASDEVNILDWGCGRGRSVLKLRDAGFNAFGVETDLQTMNNGFELFRTRGIVPEEILKHVDELKSFPDGYFDFVFSEQVLEHVEDMNELAATLSRIVKKDGLSIHQFPGTHTVEEVHLFQPFIHWLPKNILRRAAIFLWLCLGKGPEAWPEAKDRSLWGASEVYYRYSTNKTFYREILKLCSTFETCGFEARHVTLGQCSRWIPDFLRRNGFPRFNVILTLNKPE